MCGFCLGFIRVVIGFYVGPIWVLLWVLCCFSLVSCGFYLGLIWVLFGFEFGFSWALFGFFLSSMWGLFFYLGSICVRFGSYLGINLGSTCFCWFHVCVI